MNMFCYYIIHEFSGGELCGQQNCQLHTRPHHCLIEMSNEDIIALEFAFSFCYEEK
jgi:hypothetical protein